MKRVRLVHFLSSVVMLTALSFFVLPLLAVPSDLDPTWGGNGVVISPGEQLLQPYGLVVQHDNKVLLLAHDRENLLVSRYHKDGSLDQTFGQNGIATISPKSEAAVVAPGYIRPMVALPNNQIIVAGLYSNGTGLEWEPIAIVWRINQDGSLDTNFGVDGYLEIDAAYLEFNIPDGLSEIGSVVVQPDGKLLMAGYAYMPDGRHPLMMRIMPDGQLDPSFGDNGIITNGLPNFSQLALTDLILQPDGKAIFVDWLNVFRINSDGSVDASFLSDATNFSRGELLPHGRILLLETSYSGFGMQLLKPDGSIDTEFTPHLMVQSGAFYARGITIESNGKIIVTGHNSIWDYYTSNGALIARFNPDGTIDTTWDPDGYIILDDPRMLRAALVDLQADGRFLIAGSSGDYDPRPDQKAFIARLKGDPAFSYTAVTPTNSGIDTGLNAYLKLTFAETVIIGTGKIDIRRVADFSLFESIPVTDSARVTGAGTNTITINPSTHFEPNTEYFVLVDPATFNNASGHPFSGVRGLTEWHFMTGNTVINEPPILNPIGDKVVNQGELLTFTVTAYDPDEDQTLAYSLADGTNGSVPDNASIDIATGLFTWTPTDAQFGVYTFDIVATDDGIPPQSASQTINITVNALLPANLVQNPGFEEQGAAAKHAKHWTGYATFKKDRRVCNVEAKIVARTDQCAFRLKRGTASPRYIEQVISLTDTTAGQNLYAEAFVKSTALTNGASLQAIVTYADNTKAKLRVKFPSGTHEYLQHAKTLTLAQPALKIRVRLATGNAVGVLWIDDVLLTITDPAEPLSDTSDGLIPLPALPDLWKN